MTDADSSRSAPADAAGRPYDIGIIGGGAGGVLTALHALRLAREPVRIVLFEPTPTLAKGVAYATTCAEHLLNVPAQRMSAFNDAPEDFLDYVVATTPAGGPDRDALGHAFVERRRYGDYLRT
ncbi:MAG TPA: FAD/NAD(P)-binding protein, partial [Pseudoxanthomonas sp.]|nr:FAD/NAD(P)-binding protein [Pseudoxanthomonas sp.]